MRIILASSSPRRQQLMEQAGIPCEIIVSDVDESVDGEILAHEQVEQLALRKARAVRAQISGEAIIIAADTLVSLDDKVLTKPTDGATAFAMLRALQGRKHTVYTGVAIIKTGNEDETYSFVEATDVFFRPLTNYEIGGYIASDESFDKAGAYAAQGRGALLVERIEGDFFTVMGLPISRLCVELGNIGVDVWALEDLE
ncbi:MAG: Maf family protein [Defluviitaleaceae bacterium]|nr:Maf family protein [Defluviitaleaceae bacterium]